MDWFKEAVDERGIDLEELAEVLDVTVRKLRNYYNGKSQPKKKIMGNIAAILNIDPEECP